MLCELSPEKHAGDLQEAGVVTATQCRVALYFSPGALTNCNVLIIWEKNLLNNAFPA